LKNFFDTVGPTGLLVHVPAVCSNISPIWRFIAQRLASDRSTSPEYLIGSWWSRCNSTVRYSVLYFLTWVLITGTSTVRYVPVL